MCIWVPYRGSMLRRYSYTHYCGTVLPTHFSPPFQAQKVHQFYVEWMAQFFVEKTRYTFH